MSQILVRTQRDRVWLCDNTKHKWTVQSYQDLIRMSCKYTQAEYTEYDVRLTTDYRSLKTAVLLLKTHGSEIGMQAAVSDKYGNKLVLTIYCDADMLRWLQNSIPLSELVLHRISCRFAVHTQIPCHGAYGEEYVFSDGKLLWFYDFAGQTVRVESRFGKQVIPLSDYPLLYDQFYTVAEVLTATEYEQSLLYQIENMPNPETKRRLTKQLFARI